MADSTRQATEVIEERISVDAPGRKLEGLLGYGLADTAAFAALVAGPHPLLGGDMDNNLVCALRRGLAANGGVTLAFNYAGVGASEGGPADWPTVVSAFWENGRFDEEEAWVADTSAAAETLTRLCDRPRVVVGYSFGCWTAAHCLDGASAAILVSPNPKRHDFACLSGSLIPLLVIHSDNDFTGTAAEISAWTASLRDPKTLTVLDAGEHFFRGREDEVVRVVARFIDGVLS